MIRLMNRVVRQRSIVAETTLGAVVVLLGLTLGQDSPKIEKGVPKQESSYTPVNVHEDFKTVADRMQSGKPAIQQRQMSLLKERYKLGNQPS